MRESPLWRRYLRFLRPDISADVEEELRFHVESRAAELEVRGLSTKEARVEALRRFGDMARVHAECESLERGRLRRMSRLQGLADFRRDIAFAARTLLRQPAFTAAAILTLALGIGVTTAIFSAVNSLMFRPLPAREADRLVVIANTGRGADVPGNVGYLNYLDVDAQRDVLEGAAAFDLTPVSVRINAAGERRAAVPASGNYFTLLGVPALIGRTFTDADARERAPVAVLSFGYWQSAFAADRSVVGRAIQVNGIPFTVIGITPESFHGTYPFVEPDLYLPITLYAQLDASVQPMFERRDRGSVRVIARLKDGVSLAQARAGLGVLATELARKYSDINVELRFVMDFESRARPDIAVASMTPWIASVFMALVSLTLLVACANVTNLLLVRASARSAEIAVRRTLGAAPGRLVRQLLTESVLLALAALAAGLLLARWCVAWLDGLKFTTDLPIHLGITMDWRVFGFSAAIAIVSGILSGLMPAIRGARAPLTESLRDGGRGGSSGRSRRRLRNVIVVGQVAVSFVLLVCAALFSRSVAAAGRVHYGFRTDSLLMTSIDVSLLRYTEQQGRTLHDELLRRATAVPGVQAAAFSQTVPLSGNVSQIEVSIGERRADVQDATRIVFSNVVSQDYVHTTGHRLIQGREFTAQDDSAAPRVVMVNDALARLLWPGEPAVGKLVRVRKDERLSQVVGVVGNAQFLFLNEEPRPMIWRPLAQAYSAVVVLVVKSSLPPTSLTQSLRAIVHDLDPELVPYDMRTIETHLHDGFALFFVRIAATLAMAIGVLALLQTIVGLFGVLSYVVSQRTREIGVRMALGAQRRDVIGGVLRQGLVLVGVGLGIGVLLSFAVTRFLSSLLIGVTPTDLVAYGISGGLLVVLALLSCYVPALRAARLEPVLALRSDG